MWVIESFLTKNVHPANAFCITGVRSTFIQTSATCNFATNFMRKEDPEQELPDKNTSNTCNEPRNWSQPADVLKEQECENRCTHKREEKR